MSLITLLKRRPAATDLATGTPTGSLFLRDDVSWQAVPMNYVENVNTVATSGATQTLPDVTADTIHDITLTANCTFTFPTAAAGKSFTLILRQDATGSRLATWPGTMKWPGGTAPTLTTTASKFDVFTFLCANGTNWIGFTAGQNY